MSAGRKSLKEELRLFERYSELSEPYFKFLKEMFDSPEKEDKKWATERIEKAFVKMIPQEIDPTSPLQIVYMPAELMKKNGIRQDSLPRDPAARSEGHAPLPSGELREEMGQDHARSVGDDSQGSSQAQ